MANSVLSGLLLGFRLSLAPDQVTVSASSQSISYVLGGWDYPCWWPEPAGHRLRLRPVSL